MTPAALLAKIRRLDAAMEASRAKMSELASERAEAIAELARQVGVTEAGRRLGVSRVTIHRIIRDL